MRSALPLLAALACSLPEPTLEGAHVRIAADPGLAACGDLLGHMDAFVADLAAEWDRPPPTGDDRIDFHWLRPHDFADRTICVQPTSGCAWRGDVYASYAPVDHELVHALADADGLPPPFFIEGLAVAYELPTPEGLEDLAADERADLEAALFDRVLDLPARRYAVAGAFIAFLVERHGAPAVLRLYRALGLLDDRGRIARVYARELGEPLDRAIAEFSELRRDCPLRGFRLRRFECDAPVLAWDGDVLTFHRTLACGEPDVLGPSVLGTAAAYHTLEIPAPGDYAVRFVADADPGAADPPNRLLLARCGGCPGYVERRLAPGDDLDLDLPAGRYSVRFTGPVDAATGVGLRLARLPAP